MNRKRFDVFLSHSSSDIEMVRQIAEKLRRVGIKPWLDDVDISTGSFLKEMQHGLQMSNACAIFFGSGDLSRWVELEMEMAVVLVKDDPSFAVIPVLLPGFPETATLPLPLRNLVRTDFRKGIDGPHFDKFVQAIRRDVNGNGQLSREAREEGDTHMHPHPHPQPQPHAHPYPSASDTLATMAPLRDNLTVIQRHVKDLTFTPVIGPGCSLIGRSQSHAWARIGERMEHILALLEDEAKPSKYLRSLADVPAYDVALSSDSLDPTAAPSPDDPLVRLQLALARLGASLGEIFASVMQNSVMPVWDTITYKLRIPADDPRLRDMFDALVDACMAAYDLKEFGPDRRDPANCLGAPGIYDRLMDMASKFVKRQWLSELKARHAKGKHANSFQTVIEELSRSRDAGFVSEPELSIHRLEWIADALWHTFRYREAAYPRLDELAYQISLFLIGAQGARPELPSAAEVGKVILTPEIIAAWFGQFGADPPSRMVEFYDALARILREEFKEFKTRTSRSGGSTTTDQVIKPIAFSTNYDLEMESALLRVRDLSTFHVFIPINAYIAATPGELHQEMEWLFGTFHKGDLVDSPEEWEYWPITKPLTSGRIRGPIVVKLHGSPLHKLPTPDQLRESRDGEIMPFYERFEHAIVLSDAQFLDHIVQRDTLPEFLEPVLQQRERAWFFLGHSIQHWTTRLRLYSHVNRRNSPRSGSGKIAINRSYDPYRSAVLSSIGIDRLAGALEEIVPAVDAVLGYAEKPRRSADDVATAR